MPGRWTNKGAREMEAPVHVQEIKAAENAPSRTFDYIWWPDVDKNINQTFGVEWSGNS